MTEVKSGTCATVLAAISIATACVQPDRNGVFSQITGRWNRRRRAGFKEVRGAGQRTWDGTRALFPVLAFASALVVGATTVEADQRARDQAFEGLGVELLAGLSACEATINEGISPGARCLTDRAINDFLLGRATEFSAAQGRAMFGDKFRIVNRFTYAPSSAELGLAGDVHGDLDIAVPLFSSSYSEGTGESADQGAFFLQHGMTRWTDASGSRRTDVRSGVVRRFNPSGRSGDNVVGVSALIQNSLEFGHGRVVTGIDYHGSRWRGSFNLFTPTTGWRLGRAGYEERALAGSELSLNVELTSTVILDAAYGRWESDDGSDSWRTRGRVGLGWRPHPWVNFGAVWNEDPSGGSKAVRAAIVIPLGSTSKPARWQGLGIFGSRGSVTNVDPWRPAELDGRILVAKREIAETPGARDRRIVGQARVRFLQNSAPSGTQIRLEVTLPEAAPRDLDLIVRLIPGEGEYPAVPGEDYVNDPISTTMGEGATSTVVTARLLLNPNLLEARSLSATVELDS